MQQRFLAVTATRALLPSSRLTRFMLACAILLIAPQAWGAIEWDGENGSQWWYDPVNWNAASNVNTVLPPTNNAAGTQAAETLINLGTGAWNQGEGVVYDPSNDPHFAAAEAIPFPSSYSRQVINGLFMSRGTTESTLLTIKGDLTFRDPVHVGSGSGERGQSTNAKIMQDSGVVRIPMDDLVIATTNASVLGRGNGTYEYRSGTLDVAPDSGNGIFLSVGSVANAPDGQRQGPGGIGKFVIHNPSTPGRIRTYSLTTATFAGLDEGQINNPNDSVFDAAFDADGETTGVGIFEFHFANGGTRPIQVKTNMILHNGVDNNTKGKRSSRLDLILDEPACEGAACVPASVGLFDVGFDGSGSLQGTGDLDGDNNFTNDRVFSSLDNLEAYREGDMVSAVFGSTQYNWTISYTGDINWSNAANSEISSITGMDTGNDIVLIGHSSSTEGSVPGDFDGDGDVDGRDFLVWQRGESANTLSADDLAEWQTNYGGSQVANVNAVPEPTAVVILATATLPWIALRRRRTAPI